MIDTQPQVWDDIDYCPFPSNRRYYYEAVDRFPDGLVVVGDAIASFNPIYGQGMSVAVLEALGLHHVLASGEADDIGRRFFDRVADIVDTAWTMAVGADVQFPQTTGPSTPSTDAFARYLSVLFRRAHTDGEAREALMRVIAMEKPPSSLLRPGIVGRALDPRSLVRSDTIPTPTSGGSQGTS